MEVVCVLEPGSQISVVFFFELKFPLFLNVEFWDARVFIYRSGYLFCVYSVY